MPIVRKRLQPTQYVVNGDCSDKCTVNAVRLGPQMAPQVHSWYEEGLNDLKIEERARTSGLTLSHGAISRHRANHLDKKFELKANERLTELDDIEALDLIIKRGQSQIDNWKLTPSEYFKAMEMKYKLTQGSTMDAMFAAMAAAAVDRDEGPVDPSAIKEPSPLPPEEDDSSED